MEVPALADTLQMLSEAQIQISEAGDNLRRFVDDYEADPARLAEVEERLSAIYQMARKHRIGPEELPELHQRLSAELAELDGGAGSLEQLEAELGSQRATFDELATKLTDARERAAEKRSGRKQAIDGIRAATTRIPDLDVTVDASGSTLGRMRTEVGELATLVEQLSNRYDVVIIDAPATRSSFVALRLAPVIDGSILVIRSEHTRSPVAANTRDQVLDAGGDMRGAVVTGRRYHVPRAIYRWR